MTAGPLMPHDLYIARYGLARWVLRECVRANPLYVLSAACLAYGCTALSAGLNSKVGNLTGILAVLVLLHAYELAVLAVATLVLRRRDGEGGRDLHGLSIVAGLYLCGSLLALDELIAVHPFAGLILLPGVLALAWLKLAWYARQPGVLLPLDVRMAALAILSGHALSAALGAEDIRGWLGERHAQGLGWSAGWLSLLALLVVDHLRAQRGTRYPHFDGRIDPLQTTRCGGVLLALAVAAGLAHLYSADWVFDRPQHPYRPFPALFILLAFCIARWSRAREPFGFFRSACGAAPALVANMYAFNTSTALHGWEYHAGPFGLGVQLVAAAILSYIALAVLARAPGFLIGVFATLFTPLLDAWNTLRPRIPHLHALLAIAGGFILLLGGAAVSLNRKRLLAWLDPASTASLAAQTAGAASDTGDAQSSSGTSSSGASDGNESLPPSGTR